MAQAQTNSAKKNKPDVGGDAEGSPTTFHDFLGNKGLESAPLVAASARPQPEISPSATSDLGSERLGGNHFEGIAIYGSRGDTTGRESSNIFVGNKRSNSDSFMMSPRDKYPQGQADSQDSLLLRKLLRYSGGEHLRRPHDEEASFSRHQMRPTSGSFLPQSSTGGRTNANSSKWDRAMPVNPGPVLQYPPRSGQVMPFGYQSTSNRFKDMNVAPPLVSQTAADEGSRTGIKGSGILSSINATETILGRQPAGVLIRSGKQKSGVGISEPEPSAAPSPRGTDSGGHQMTIFYGGQAHVFDNVHPSKAEIIMALAGSNGGSWSTTYKPNSGARPTSAGENCRSGDNTDVGISILKELQDARPPDMGDSRQRFGSGSRE